MQILLALQRGLICFCAYVLVYFIVYTKDTNNILNSQKNENKIKTVPVFVRIKVQLLYCNFNIPVTEEIRRQSWNERKLFP